MHKLRSGQQVWKLHVKQLSDLPGREHCSQKSLVAEMVAEPAV